MGGWCFPINNKVNLVQVYPDSIIINNLTKYFQLFAQETQFIQTKVELFSCQNVQYFFNMFYVFC